MRKVWRDVLIFSAVAVSIPLVVLLLIRLTPKPPIGQMEHARAILSEAEKNKADTYSRKLYNEAKVFYDSAMVNWQRENKRFLYFRHYDKVIKFAELCTKKASQAGDNSISTSSNLKIKLKAEN